MLTDPEFLPVRREEKLATELSQALRSGRGNGQFAVQVLKTHPRILHSELLEPNNYK